MELETILATILCYLIVSNFILTFRGLPLILRRLVGFPLVLAMYLVYNVVKRYYTYTRRRISVFPSFTEGDGATYVVISRTLPRRKYGNIKLNLA